LVGDDGALLLPPRGFKKAAPVFSTSPETADSFWTLLALAPRLPVLILADTQAQDFKREPLPPVSFFDRQKLLARRLEQTFPKALLKTAHLSHDGTALFAHLEEQGPLGRWLTQLESQPNPSGQICALPLESAAMMARLVPASAEGWGLLLSCQKTGGFRQIVTRKGEMIFTRLTPPLPAMAHPDYVAESLAQDIQATRSYLARTGLREETPLHLAAILPAALHQAFTTQPLPVASQILFSPREAAARLALPMPPQPDEPIADLVHALWLQTRPRPQATLMRPEDRAALSTRRLQKGGLRLALVAGLIALGLAGEMGHRLYALDQANNRVQADVAALEASLDHARRTLAREAAPLDHLRKAIERRRLFTMPHKGPEKLIPLLSGALGPEARLVALDWQDGTLTIDILLKDDGARSHITELTRQKITRNFDNLAFMLRGALEGYDVTITRYPYPNLPNETLTNKDDHDKEPPPIATFVIRKDRADGK